MALRFSFSNAESAEGLLRKRCPTRESHMEVHVFQGDSATKSCATQTQDRKYREVRSTEICMHSKVSQGI